MNLDSYRIAWRAEDATSHLPIKEELENMIGSIVRSERRSRIVLTACAMNTLMALLLVLGIMLFRRPVDWSEITPILIVQLILAYGLAWLIRQRNRRRRELESATGTIREATMAGLANVKGEMRDARVLLMLASVAIPLFAVAVSQLIASGKMNGQAASSFAMLLAGIIAVNAAILWRRHRRVLVPQRRRMEQIMASLEN